jgi:hypothetical protein
LPTTPRYIPAGVTQCAAARSCFICLPTSDLFGLPSDHVSDCLQLAAIRQLIGCRILPSASNGCLPAAAQLGFLLPPNSL